LCELQLLLITLLNYTISIHLPVKNSNPSHPAIQVSIHHAIYIHISKRREAHVEEEQCVPRRSENAVNECGTRSEIKSREVYFPQLEQEQLEPQLPITNVLVWICFDCLRCRDVEVLVLLTMRGRKWGE